MTILDKINMTILELCNGDDRVWYIVEMKKVYECEPYQEYVLSQRQIYDITEDEPFVKQITAYTEINGKTQVVWKWNTDTLRNMVGMYY